MSCIKTYTGIMFDPITPDADLINTTDIAHALSMLCRANGHFKSFYSVAQHSINCMREAAARGYSDRVRLACLLHDASEAYLSDVTRPVKAELPRYKEIEAPLQEMIWSKWLSEPLTDEERRQVFEIDDALLAHEFLNLMDTMLFDVLPKLYSTPEFGFAGFDATKSEFLQCFARLTVSGKE
ncbi:MAG: phosphohydrolase [Clostridia bacterium]|nr:phosphohydrolase [Clostridia bacterium]